MNDNAFAEEVLDEIRTLDADLYSLGKNKRLADSIGMRQLQKTRTQFSTLAYNMLIEPESSSRFANPTRSGMASSSAGRAFASSTT